MTNTEKIKELQRRIGVKADGIIGPVTLDALLSLTTDSVGSVGSVESLHERMAAKILNMEDYRVTGPESLRVTPLPSGDGGGKWEIAGICDGIEPEMFKAIKKELDQGNRDTAWTMCLDYVIENTDSAVTFGKTGVGVEFMLRDIIFNMGKGGCIKVMQSRVGVKVDGAFGPITRKAWMDYINKTSEVNVIKELDDSCRQRYYNIAKANPVKKKFLKGWMNRCDEREKFALKLISM